MLDRLIESKNHTKESKRLGGFMATTATGAFAVLLFALIYSLFASDIALASGDDLMLSALVAPVQIAEQKPQEEIATAAPKPQISVKTSETVPTRRVNMLRVDEVPTKVPDNISVNQNQAQARPAGRFNISDVDSSVPSSGAYTNERGTGTGLGSKVGSSDSLKSSGDDDDKNAGVEPPPIIVKPVVKEVEQPKTVKTISGGVVNGKAANLVMPVYSPAAKAVRAQGEVRVAVTIDEDGRVISANALGGHPLLAQSAVNAARASKFTPTFLSKQKVKVTGVIVYNFKI